MKRKVTHTPCRIWTFGAQPPTENAELFREQLWKAHRYYNTLIELERKRRDGYRAARAQCADTAALEEQHAALQKSVEELRAQIKQRRAAARKRVLDAEIKVLIAQVRTLSEQRSEAYARLKLARAEVKSDPQLLAARERLDQEKSARVKEARKASEVYWGSYLLVEKAVESASKSALDPDFKRWRGEGRVGVQLHHEKFQDIVEGKSAFLRIHLNAPRKESKRAKKRIFGTVQLRAGSVGRTTPIWISFPIILHRMPPPDAVLTWAWVKATKVGTDTRYELQLTIESEAFAQATVGRGVAAIDVGWRALENGDLRVGYLRDDVGREQELRLPARLITGLAFADQLRSYRSQHFDTAREVWGRWLAAFDGLADWLTEAKQTLHLWKSPARLARAVAQWIAEADAREALDQLWEAWRTERLAAGADLFDTFDVAAAFVSTRSDVTPTMFYMDLWRRKDKHLCDWEAHQRLKCLRRRTDIYRNIARQLADRYETVVFEDMDHRQLAQNAQPEAETLDYLHRVRNMAAPGELRSICRSTLGKSRVHEEVTKDSTREGACCGHVSTWTAQERAQRVLTCQGCGAEWDQDANAAHVLLKRYFERFGGAGTPAGARSGSGAAVSGAPSGTGGASARRARRNRSQPATQGPEIVAP